MDNSNVFYRKKLQRYVDARSCIERAINDYRHIQTLERSAPGCDLKELEELGYRISRLEELLNHSNGMIDAVQTLVDIQG